MLSKVLTVTVLLALTPFAQSSVDHGAIIGPPPPQPVVTASSSQYFERTFNRIAPVFPEPVPVIPGPSVITGPQVIPGPQLIPGSRLIPGQQFIPGQQVIRGPQLILEPPVIQSNSVLPPQPLAHPVLQAPTFIQTHSVLPPRPAIQTIPAHQIPDPTFIQTHSVLPVRPVLPFHSGPQAFLPQPFIPQPVLQPPVFFQPVPNSVPSTPVNVNSSQAPVDPNVAIAIATAHSAAPVATFLLPPYPFGFPSGFVPPAPPFNPEDRQPESTTQAPTQEIQTTVTEPEQTTPQPSPSNIDNNFVQGLPNQNVNFKYGPPPDTPRPLQPFPLQGQDFKPQKYKTSVEVVPVPLSYIAPPPLTYAQLHHHHHHQYNHHYHNPHPHHHAKLVKYYVKTVPVPARAKIIIRPVSTVNYMKPVIVKKYRVPVSWERSDVVDPQIAIGPKEREPTTIGPINSPTTKPPKI